MIDDIDLIVKATGFSEEDVNKVLTVWLEVALLQIVFYQKYATIFGTIELDKKTGTMQITEQNPRIVEIISNSYEKSEIIDMLTEEVVKFDRRG